MCILSCSSGDLLCIASCSRELQDNLLFCPCQSGCPNGCPCEEYVCPTTTPSTITTTALTTTTTSTTTTASAQKTEVLMLNTREFHNVPVITNASGRQDRNFFFLYGENTAVYNSFGLTFRGEYFIFFGDSKKNQISKIEGCQLKNIGQLAFSHNSEGCASVGNNKIYLCFNNNSADYKSCRVL